MSEEQVFKWVEPLIGDCKVMFRKSNTTTLSDTLRDLGADIYLLHRDLQTTKHFGEYWSIFNLFLIPEGMVIYFKQKLKLFFLILNFKIESI